MTSKEALIILFASYNYNGNYQELIEAREKLEKDLEVLEILKNNLYEEKGTGRFKGCNTINCSLGNQHSGIDYTKVKEWLTNDNN